MPRADGRVVVHAHLIAVHNMHDAGNVSRHVEMADSERMDG